ncbi:MAG: hypothetical protein U1E05_23395 [Patescibacteria group bacterium]|nr:hypothetical protein [Patescibacteria group bacterium]
MPRIAATLGVFGLVVMALGLNITQFPIEYRVAVPTAQSPGTVSEPMASDSHTPVVSLRPPDWQTGLATKQPDEQMPIEPPRREGLSERSLSRDESAGVGAGMPMLEEPREREGWQESGPPEASQKPVDGRQEVLETRQPAEVEGSTGLFGQFPLGVSGMPEAETASGQRPDNAAGGEVSGVRPREETPAAPPSEVRSSPYDPSLSLGGGFGVTGYGGVYNPLEPQPEREKTDSPTIVQPTSVAPLEGVAPSVAIPGPTYGRDLMSDITAGRAVVPIGGEQGDGSPPSAQEVVRLPSTDRTEAGQTAVGPSDLTWYPAEGYPITPMTQ